MCAYGIFSWFNLILQTHPAFPPFPKSIQRKVLYQRETVSWQSVLVKIHNRPKSFLESWAQSLPMRRPLGSLFSGVLCLCLDHVKHCPTSNPFRRCTMTTQHQFRDTIRLSHPQPKPPGYRKPSRHARAHLVPTILSFRPKIKPTPS